MSVRQGRDRSCRCVPCKLIAFRHSRFAPCVSDLLTVRILGQLLDSCFPAVSVVQRHCLNIFSSVAQGYCQARRSLSILVVIIVPHLLDRCFSLFRCVAVRQGCDRAFRCRSGKLIAFRQTLFIFCPCIGDFLTISVLRKTANSCFPAILLAQRHGLNVFGSVAQRYLQACRSLSVLVVRITPYLLDRC